jgi:hypothetical protein
MSFVSSQGSRVVSVATHLAVVAGVWVCLYVLNDWLFSQVAISVYASWIFLPAALRMLAVLLCGWVGVAGLFIGSLMTAFAGLSALAPMMAYLLCIRWFNWQSDLRGLSATQLVVLSLLVALIGASMHNLHLIGIGAIDSFGPTFVTMFVGDMAGTFIVLYAAKFLLGFMPIGDQSAR